jgi:hypothetical protein
MTDLAILYEHPAWFAPLFAALERRGVDFVTMGPGGDWNPAATRAPAPVMFNRIAMSSFLRAGIADGGLPGSIDGVLLVQEYVPVRGGAITRIETLDKRFLYAIDVAGGGAFDLCPADACVVPGSGISMAAVEPAAALRDAAERIAEAVGMDVGGVELMIDDRDGVARFYDINALSNFVARPLDVLGWDPHDRLVDFLIDTIGKAR